MLDMWFWILGMPSAEHLSMMALDLTPSSFAMSNTRLAKLVSARVAFERLSSVVFPGAGPGRALWAQCVNLSNRPYERS